MQHDGNQQGVDPEDNDLRKDKHSAFGAAARVQGSESDEANAFLPQHSILRVAASVLAGAVNVAIDELERIVPLKLDT